MLHLLLSRQFRMNDRNLCYFHLAQSVFSDTTFAITVLRRGTDVHKYMPQTLDVLERSQSSKIEAQKSSSCLFAIDGIPLACICDNAKEIIQGKFY